MDAPTLDRAAQTAAGIARRFPLPARISDDGMAILRAQWAEIDACAASERDARQDFVSRPSRFVGIQSGLPHHTTA